MPPIIQEKSQNCDKNKSVMSVLKHNRRNSIVKSCISSKTTKEEVTVCLQLGGVLVNPQLSGV